MQQATIALNELRRSSTTIADEQALPPRSQPIFIDRLLLLGARVVEKAKHLLIASSVETVQVNNERRRRRR
jgi:hypothetical protein